MKKLTSLLAVALIALPISASAAGTVNTTWFQCQADKDCVPVQTGCNKWEGVNKKYAKNFAATISKQQMYATGCPTPEQMRKMKKAAKPKCLTNYCTVILPKTSP
jgi:hypothetical protein